MSSIFVVSRSIFSSILWAQSLTLKANTTNLDINNPLQLTVEVKEIQWNGNLAIKGIEDFNIVSQSQVQNMQIINGEKSWSLQFQFQIKAKDTGDFTIGPAQIQIGTGLIQSNTIKLKVTGEKLFVNGAPAWRQTNPTVKQNDDVTKWTKWWDDKHDRDELVNHPNGQPDSSDEITKGQDNKITLRSLAWAWVMILIVLRWGKKKRKDNRSKKQSWTSPSKTSPQTPLSSKREVGGELISIRNCPHKSSKDYQEKLEQRIRSYIGNRLKIDTKSLTFKELHTLRAKAHGETIPWELEWEEAVKKKNRLLHQILAQLERSQYAGQEIDKDELHKMVGKWKENVGA